MSAAAGPRFAHDTYPLPLDTATKGAFTLPLGHTQRHQRGQAPRTVPGQIVTLAGAAACQVNSQLRVDQALQKLAESLFIEFFRFGERCRVSAQQGQARRFGNPLKFVFCFGPGFGIQLRRRPAWRATATFDSILCNRRGLQS